MPISLDTWKLQRTAAPGKRGRTAPRDETFGAPPKPRRHRSPDACLRQEARLGTTVGRLVLGFVAAAGLIAAAGCSTVDRTCADHSDCGRDERCDCEQAICLPAEEARLTCDGGADDLDAGDADTHEIPDCGDPCLQGELTPVC